MEVVSEAVQRFHFMEGMDNATQRVNVSDQQASELGIPDDVMERKNGRLTKREIGLYASEESWSAEIEVAYAQGRYRNAMDEVTEPLQFEVAGETKERTMWELGVLFTDENDWLVACQNRGVPNYLTAMTTVEPDERFPRAVREYEDSMSVVMGWLDEISMPNRIRTNTFNAEAQVNNNIERCRSVAVGLVDQARGQELPNVATGQPVPVQTPSPQSLRVEYWLAMDEFGAAARYSERMNAAGPWDAPPTWKQDALDGAEAWNALDTRLDSLENNWHARAGAIGDSEFMGEATSETAREKYTVAASEGEALTTTTDRYMNNWTPYREALSAVPLDELLPRGAIGSDQNINRAALVAGVMMNAKYISYSIPDDEFRPYGEGVMESWEEWYDGVLDAIPWIG